jgi:4-hydroxybenzoate polyprenyltransferase
MQNNRRIRKMATAHTSKKRAHALSTALFLIGLAVLAFMGNWWPGIMLAAGIPLAIRQYLLGRTYDMCISLLVFVGTFVTVQFDITWQVFLPILFTIGAIYVLCREFMTPDPEDESDKEEDLQHEIEEEKKS